MKFKLVLLLFAVASIDLFSADINEDVANSLKVGNSKELSKYFGATVELKINEQEEIYSRAQAEQIIKEFFLKNIIKSFSYSHASAVKNESSYAIGTLTTAKGNFRIYILFKKSGTTFVIQQLRIESGNE